jgi:hypothetical protein
MVKFEPQQKKVYRLNAFGKARICAIAILMFIASGIFAVKARNLPQPWMILPPVLFAVSGIYFVLLAFTYRVSVDEKSVTVAGPISKSSINRSDVLGRRRIFGNGQWTPFEFALISRISWWRGIHVLADVNFDREWEHWYWGLPNLERAVPKPKQYKKARRKHM